MKANIKNPTQTLTLCATLCLYHTYTILLLLCARKRNMKHVPWMTGLPTHCLYFVKNKKKKNIEKVTENEMRNKLKSGHDAVSHDAKNATLKSKIFSYKIHIKGTKCGTNVYFCYNSHHYGITWWDSNR